MAKGMILGAMGQAIANTGAQVSGMMTRDADREDQRQFQAEQNALYRRPADMIGAGRGGSGGNVGPDGLKLADMQEGTLGGSLVAGMAGMTGPELARLEAAQKSGNFDEFKTAKKQGEYGAAGPEKLSPEEFEAARMTYPPGVSEESIRSKFQILAQIRTGMMMGSDNKAYAEGERTRQEINASDAAMRKPGQAGTIAQAMAAGDGKGAYSKVNVNEFSGEPTKVGESVIEKNERVPIVRGGGRAAADDTGKMLSQERTGADSSVRSSAKQLSELIAATKNVSRADMPAHQAAITAARAKVEKAEGGRDEVLSRIRARSTGGSAPTAQRAQPAAGTTKGGSKYTIIK